MLAHRLTPGVAAPACQVVAYRPQRASLLTGGDHRYTLSRDGRSVQCSAACLRPAATPAVEAAVEATARGLVGRWVELTSSPASGGREECGEGGGDGGSPHAAFAVGSVCLLSSCAAAADDDDANDAESSGGRRFRLTSPDGRHEECCAADCFRAASSAQVEACLVEAGVAEVGAWVQVVQPPDGWSSHRVWGSSVRGGRIAVGDLCRVSRYQVQSSSGHSFTISREGVSATCSALCLRPVDVQAAEAALTAAGAAANGSWVELICPLDGTADAATPPPTGPMGPPLGVGDVCQVLAYDSDAAHAAERFTVGRGGRVGRCSAQCIRAIPMRPELLTPLVVDIGPLLASLVGGFSTQLCDALPVRAPLRLRAAAADSLAVRRWRLGQQLGLPAERLELVEAADDDEGMPEPTSSLGHLGSATTPPAQLRLAASGRADATSAVDVLDGLCADARSREAHLALLRVCARTLSDGADGTEGALRTFASVVDRLALEERVEAHELRLVELRRELSSVEARELAYKIEAAESTEQLRRLRLQLGAAARLNARRSSQPAAPAERPERLRVDGDGGQPVVDLDRPGRGTIDGGVDGGVPGGAGAGADAIAARLMARERDGGDPPSVEEARELVEAIRREKLVHEYVPEALRAAVSGQQRSLQQAISLLAHDIYSSEGRFVHELLQNADDCDFGRATADGRARFSLFLDAARSTLWTHTGERGFTARDVLALCNVGASTKAGVAGLIGQKGVGWKACFAVSSRPGILSGSFGFSFCAGTFVVPQWEDASTLGAATWPAGLRALAVPSERGCEGTVNCLPLDRGDHLSAPLDGRRLRREIIPEVLLFLHQLTDIELHDVAAGEGIAMSVASAAATDALAPCWQPGRRADAPLLRIERQRLPPSADEATIGVGIDGGESEPSYGRRPMRPPVPAAEYFFVHSVPFDVPAHIRALEPRRAAADVTTVQLAFRVAQPADGGCGGSSPDGSSPGSGGGRSRWTLATPTEESLFAFLPVRRVGLRFICNADWLLTASREDVHDCAWNSFLLEQIPAVFEGALRRWPQLFEGAEVAALVPTASQLRGFWAPLVSGMRAQLRDVRCILTEEGTLARPRDCLLRPHDGSCPHSLIDGQMLAEHSREAHVWLRCRAVGGAVACTSGVETRQLYFVKTAGRPEGVDAATHPAPGQLSRAATEMHRQLREMGVRDLDLPRLTRLVRNGLARGRSLVWLEGLLALVGSLLEGATEADVAALLALPFLPCEPLLECHGPFELLPLFSSTSTAPWAAREPIFLAASDERLRRAAVQAGAVVRTLALPLRPSAPPKSPHSPTARSPTARSPTRSRFASDALPPVDARRPPANAPSGNATGCARALMRLGLLPLGVDDLIDALVDALVAPGRSGATSPDGSRAAPAGASPAAPLAHRWRELRILRELVLPLDSPSLKAAAPKLHAYRHALRVPASAGELREVSSLSLPTALGIYGPESLTQRHVAAYPAVLVAGDMADGPKGALGQRGGAVTREDHAESLKWEVCHAAVHAPP